MEEIEEELPDAEDLDLDELWEFKTGFLWRRHGFLCRRQDFLAHLRTIVANPDAIDDIEFCDDCGAPQWELTPVKDGSVSICDSCLDEWPCCDSCEYRYPEDDLISTLGGSEICRCCRDNCYTYCDHCEGYYHDDDSGDHHHSGCDCESPQQVFAIRNDGCEPLSHDTRAVIALPAGIISADGLTAVRRYLQMASSLYHDLSWRMEKLGDQWQAKDGNFTKRLSRLAYKEFQLTLPPDVLSQVGCIARDHSRQVNAVIEITRDLNMRAEDFYHEDSCWWGGYSESRCALKTNGGFGLRSFNDDTVSGRAWVLPLRKDERGRMVPTFDTMTPDAFIVFNGYGDLNNYAPARILSHMTGWTYRKITFECSPMYINAGGYLIAPEGIATQYTDLSMSVSQHANLFQTEKETASV